MRPGKFWQQTAVLNFEYDWELLSKNRNFIFPGLQMMANANHRLEMLLILCARGNWIGLLLQSKDCNFQKELSPIA
jgi:hypothetical protein